MLHLQTARGAGCHAAGAGMRVPVLVSRVLARQVAGMAMCASLFPFSIDRFRHGLIVSPLYVCGQLFDRAKATQTRQPGARPVGLGDRITQLPALAAAAERGPLPGHDRGHRRPRPGFQFILVCKHFHTPFKIKPSQATAAGSQGLQTLWPSTGFANRWVPCPWPSPYRTALAQAAANMGLSGKMRTRPFSK